MAGARADKKVGWMAEMRAALMVALMVAPMVAPMVE